MIFDCVSVPHVYTQNSTKDTELWPTTNIKWNKVLDGNLNYLAINIQAI